MISASWLPWNGDVILTGTPTGSTVVNPGDVVEVEVSAGEESSGRLRSPITEADYRFGPPGAMPRADDAAREAAYGAAHQTASSHEILAGLREVSTTSSGCAPRFAAQPA
jgi:hypothetical protein